MRKLVLFVLLPVCVPSYFGFNLYQKHETDTSSKDLVRGVELYKNHKGQWPRDFDSLVPYLEAPEKVRQLSPTFVPINGQQAYMEETVWSNISARRASFLVSENSSGACSLQPIQRL